jgi:hypothetical protein
LAPKLRAATWLDEHTGPAEAVVVDDQVIAVLAHRLVPSALTDTSTIRCDSGYLTLATLRTGTQTHQVKAVLLTRALLSTPYTKCAPYVPWLRLHYTLVKLPPGLGAPVAYLRP